ncbi:MAG: hypothetical protein ACM3QS_02230, partial [Bacteroidota bacterium]
MKQIVLVSALSAALWLAACAAPASNATPTSNAGGKIDEEAEVRNLVLGFGKRLQDVSLQAPDAAQEMEDR